MNKVLSSDCYFSFGHSSHSVTVQHGHRKVSYANYSLWHKILNESNGGNAHTVPIL